MDNRSILNIADIMEWAEEFHEQQGRWPTHEDGQVSGKDFTWMEVDMALKQGQRGLRGGSSLAKLLLKLHGRRHPHLLPDFEIEQILAWADAHSKRTKLWPTEHSGKIGGVPDETWEAVNAALVSGLRGLPGGSTFPLLLAERRGLRKKRKPPDLAIEKILFWVDVFHARTGTWPKRDSSPVKLPPGETWSSINYALGAGTRGLPEGGSLARLLAAHRGVRNERELAELSTTTILAWADAHHERTGKWPTRQSGPIAEAPGETWNAVEAALRIGCRGLSEGDSLPRLLARERGVRNHLALPKLSISKILAWAKKFRKCFGRWPSAKRKEKVPGQDLAWDAISDALSTGLRGLPGGSSLARLLMERCGHRHHHLPPKLTIKQILAWADAHLKRTNSWPHCKDGKIFGAPGESWAAVDAARRNGIRGLPAGSSLARLLSKRRGVRHHLEAPPLTAEQILTWADAYHSQTGAWPTRRTVDGEPAPGESWRKIDNALKLGERGLPKGGSLPRLLARHRGVRNCQELPPLQVPSILAWADAHHEGTGRWPTSKSGPISEAPGETWGAVQGALHIGVRGFPGGDSLFWLLQRHGRERSL